jgi:hypothetical protein
MTCSATSVNQVQPTLTPDGAASGLRFCALVVNRYFDHFEYAGRVEGVPPAENLIVAVDHFDTNTQFADCAKPVPADAGGYYFLGKITPGVNWSFYDPSTIGPDKLTLRRFVSYYFANAASLEKIQKQADEHAWDPKNSGFKLQGSGIGPELARLTIEPIGTPGGCR